MPTENRPLILVTNDDGIRSPGLLAAVRAVHDLGEILVVAPRSQQSASSRSIAYELNQVYHEEIEVDGAKMAALSIEGSPAQAVRYGIMIAARGKPDLVISGINYGENVGIGLTISGTIGAAMEAASFGIASLAVSLETEQKYHLSHSLEVDFSTAAYFTRLLAGRLLSSPLPEGVDILKVDVPREATPTTPWRLTRLSRQSYFHATIREDENRERRLIGYQIEIDLDALEPDSDIYALALDRVVSVSPLTIDLSAKVEWTQLAHWLSAL